MSPTWPPQEQAIESSSIRIGNMCRMSGSSADQTLFLWLYAPSRTVTVVFRLTVGRGEKRDQNQNEKHQKEGWEVRSRKAGLSHNDERDAGIEVGMG